jgi:hypothetical protein
VGPIPRWNGVARLVHFVNILGVNWPETGVNVFDVLKHAPFLGTAGRLIHILRFCGI